MQILLVIIEKIGDEYFAYSPNMLGVKVRGISREEVEREIITAMEKHLADLQQRIGKTVERIQLSQRPVVESVPCLYLSTATAFWCYSPPKKDGLCALHWRMLHGHAPFRRDPKSPCLLCGEKNLRTLEKWEVPCPVKEQNPDWPTLLEQERARVSAWRKETGANKRLEWWQKLGRAPEVTKPTPPPKEEKPYHLNQMNQKEFARRAGISLYALRKLEQEGKVKFVWMAAQKIFHVSELEKFLSGRDKVDGDDNE